MLLSFHIFLTNLHSSPFFLQVQTVWAGWCCQCVVLFIAGVELIINTPLDLPNQVWRGGVAPIARWSARSAQGVCV